MLFLIKIFLVFPLVLVLIEDLRFRAVHLFLFGLIFTGLTVIRVIQIPIVDFATQFGINLALLMVYLILTSLYFMVRRKSWIILTNGFIGLGDILFFICLAVPFDFHDFAIVFPLSLLFSLVGWLVLSLNKKQAKMKVPLAGLQALFTLIFFSLNELGIFQLASLYPSL